jgi:cell division protein FtsZ
MEIELENVLEEVENTVGEVEIMPEVDYYSTSKAPIIKVLGVGGGGSNAARYMYNMGIEGVDFIICNTDKQHLEDNPIPVKIQLGKTGWGAGADPDVANKAALESEEQIKKALEGTKMLFITAGMGKGTGTGASPIIANLAKEMGILTVAIVTYPFDFEGEEKFRTAQKGIDELGQNVDAMIVIKNESLFTYYPDAVMSNCLSKSDEVLSTAAKSIAEIITLKSNINVDFNDVSTILRKSGRAIIGSGTAGGENRAEEATKAAVNCPLLDTNSVYGAGKILFFVSYSHQHELESHEFKMITEVLANKTCNMKDKLIWGIGYDDTLEDKVRVTVIATHLQGTIPPPEPVKIKHNEGAAPWMGEPRGKVVEEPKIVEKQETTPSVEQKPKPAVFTTIIDNDAMRRMTEKEVGEYLETPPYLLRKKVLQGSRQDLNNELSNYQAGANGQVDCQPAYLKSVMD